MAVFLFPSKNNFSKKDLRRLCRIYNIEISYVIGREDESNDKRAAAICDEYLSRII